MKKVNYHGVMVVGYGYGKESVSDILKLVNQGRTLGEFIHEKTKLILYGEHLNELCEELQYCGIDTIYKMDYLGADMIDEEIYTDLCYQLITEEKPEILLFPSSVHFRSIASRLSIRLNTGLTADCLQFEMDTEKRLLQQIRPAYEGTKIATIVCPEHRPQMATVHIAGLNNNQSAGIKVRQIVVPDLSVKADTAIQVCRRVWNRRREKKDSKVIIGVGRGIKGPEELNIIKEFADLAGGCVMGTRAAVDAGLLEYDVQIGITGEKVCCELYFAFGISGAVQHLAGIDTKKLVAVNLDEEASIFKAADYGIVGDCKKIVPLLIKKYLEIRKE